MMKSFFKKLAFVMALAMVVTLAAPAGSAFAASALRVVDADKNVCTTYELAVGETEDFAFWDAKNWTNYTWAWESSDPEVASVDKGGVVEGLTDGVATITVTGSLDGEVVYSGEVVVTVGEGEVEEVVDNSYVYDQVSHNEATFTFNHDVEYTLADVTLIKVFAGGYEVNWPIETFKCEKNVVTIKPYVAFADGDEYIIHIGAEDEGTAFTTTIGEVDYIELAWKSLDKDGVAYAKLNDDDEDIEVTLSAKLFSQGVDVSKAEGFDTSDIEFELVQDNEDVTLSEDGILTFDGAGVAAVVKVTYTFEKNGEEVVKENVATVVSVPAPKYTIVSVDKWTIASASNLINNYAQIDWTGAMTHSIPAFDETDHQIVVLMTDSYGNKIVYPNEFAALSKKIGNTTVLALSDIQDSSKDCYIEASEDFEIRYTSTNLEKILVGLDKGDITTLGESKAPILVSLYDENEDYEVVLAKNLFAASLNVTGMRVIDSITATVKFDKLLVDTKDLVDADYEKGKVEFVVKDQYGAAYSGVSVHITESHKDVSIDTYTGSTNWQGKASYTFNGSSFIVDGKNVSGVTFKAEVQDPNTWAKESTSFKIKTATPKVKENVLTTEGYRLSVYDVDQKVGSSYDSDGTKTDDYGNYYTDVKTTIKFLETSNDLDIRLANTELITAGDSRLKNGLYDFSVKSNAASKGALYLVVYNPDGKALSEVEANELGIHEVEPGKYEVGVATTNASGNAMTYIKAGNYTVKAYRVTSVSKNGNDNASLKDYTATFTVKNTTNKVTLKKQEVIDVANFADDVVINTKEDVIFNIFDFNFGNGNLKEDAENISVDYIDCRYNADSNQLFIYSIKFNVPLDNNTDDVTFNTGAVKVNKAVKITDEYAELLGLN